MTDLIIADILSQARPPAGRCTSPSSGPGRQVLSNHIAVSGGSTGYPRGKPLLGTGTLANEWGNDRKKHCNIDENLHIAMQYFKHRKATDFFN
ncbi:MAG: hypothetical protein RIB84_04275 [Sneathiellaceae bacterium]